ncbi:MAG: hypothetical protein NZ898_16155, partial [Myxococcota bacterium]|nr:hypothetical protein [Myxococcota bacterium]MDW8364023.1 hypothetical protein [Myxococcales bacterium]
VPTGCTMAAAMRRPLPHACLPAVLLAAACGGEPVAGVPVVLVDPGVILREAIALRLMVFDAGGYACDPSSGRLTPSPDETLGAAIPDAIADVMPVAGREERIDVRPGRYALLARAWGTDPVSMRMRVVIGTGCATEDIADGETRAVVIRLVPVFGEGVCGDRVLSPDEQCDDGGTAPGDGCDAGCRTEPFTVNTTTPMMQSLPDAAWADGGRLWIAFDQPTTRDIALVARGPHGELVTSPTALSVEGYVTVPGVQTDAAVSVAGGRVAVALRTGFVSTDPMGDVQLQLFDLDRTPLGALVRVQSASDGAQSDPDVATRDDGSSLVVWTDSTSPTGLKARLVSASGAPAGSDAVVVGQGATLASTPAVVATPTGFALAFAAGGDVFVQRLDPMGMPADDTARRVVEGADGAGTQDQPTIAAHPDGRLLVAWRDSDADADGTAVRARLFAADGMPVGMPFVLATTTAGDQSRPACTFAASRYLCAWVSGGEIRARLLQPDGSPALNRERPPGTGDFAVATGAVSEPAVAANGSGSRAVVVWQDAGGEDGDIRARLFPLP